MAILETFDVAVMHALNGLVGAQSRLDRLIRTVADWPAVRCAPLMIVLWWAWFAKPDARPVILSGLAAAAIASLVSRLMQVAVTVHARPFVVADRYGFKIPQAVKSDWGHGSSFPSDTTTLHVALAVLIAIVVPRLGKAAIAWALLAIAVPRAYLTYHWPSDIIAGALLGAAFVVGFARSSLVQSVCARIADFDVRAPQYLYPAGFLLAYQLMTAFEDVVHALRLVGIKS